MGVIDETAGVPGDIAGIPALPVGERIRLVAAIRDSIAARPQDVPLGDAQSGIIDQRLADHLENPGDVVTRDEVLAEAGRG